jgi:hypothetical protein
MNLRVHEDASAAETKFISASLEVSTARVETTVPIWWDLSASSNEAVSV